jgi:hypothetical protein
MDVNSSTPRASTSDPEADGALLDRTFGMITGQSGSPRRVMIAAKFVF